MFVEFMVYCTART